MSANGDTTKKATATPAEVAKMFAEYFGIEGKIERGNEALAKLKDERSALVHKIVESTGRTNFAVEGKGNLKYRSRASKKNEDGTVASDAKITHYFASDSEEPLTVKSA